jgi:hypothetical protein
MLEAKLCLWTGSVAGVPVSSGGDEHLNLSDDTPDYGEGLLYGLNGHDLLTRASS